MLGAVIVHVTSDNVSAGAEEDFVAELKGWEITVSPAAFSYDDEITVAMSGLPRNFPFDTSSVSLGGVKLTVPNPGDGPRGKLFSDYDGKFVFKTTVPVGLSSGPHYLRVDIPGNFVARTLVDLQPVTLRVSSASIVPFQELWVAGMGFTKATGIGGKSSKTIKDMYQKIPWSAGVTISGEMVHEPYIEYPVRLGRDGSTFFKMIVPELESTTTPGQVELRVMDSEGREGVATLTVPTVGLQLDSYVSYPGENVTFSITGLPVPREHINDYVEVVYGYAMDTSGTKHAPKPLGSFIPNGTGGISGSFDIPEESLLSSSNKVWVTASNGMRWAFDHHLAGRSISIEPTSGLQGDLLHINIKGMPRNYPLVVGSISLGGHRIKVPGHLGESGSSPISNQEGFLSFVSVIPTGVEPGDRSLIWAPPGGGAVSTTFHVMESKLNFSPPSVTPGQEVTMTSELHSAKMQGVEISGSDSSYVYIDDEKKFHEVIDYPIPISSDGGFETVFNVPVNRDIAAKTSVVVTTKDTAGRTARGTLLLKQRSVTVTPTESVLGSTISVEGTGFFANADGAKSLHRVIIFYKGVRIGSETLNASGSFKKKMNVPAFASAGTENQIKVEPEGWRLLTVYSSHRIPKSEAIVTPTAASPGDTVFISGTGFTPFRQVTVGIGHLWARTLGSVVHTDELGRFEVSVKVPMGLIQGVVDLKVYAHYPIEVASIPFNVR